MYDTNEKIATQGKGGFLFIYYIIASALIGDNHKTHKTKSPYIWLKRFFSLVVTSQIILVVVSY